MTYDDIDSYENEILDWLAMYWYGDLEDDE